MVEWEWIILYRCALMGRFYEFTCRAAKPTVSDGPIFRCTFFTNLSTKPTTSGGAIVLFCVFTGRATKPTVSGGDILPFTFLPAFSFRNDLRWPHLSLFEER